MTGHDVVIISSIDWNEVWQAHQEIASRLARAGNRVLFIENLGIRLPRLSRYDLRRVAGRIRRWIRRSRKSTTLRENLWIVSPMAIPGGGRFSRWVDHTLTHAAIIRKVKKLGFRDPIIWIFLPTDSARHLAARLAGPRSVRIYYGLADFPLLAGARAAAMEHSERRMVEQADLVFANGLALADRYRAWREDVHYFPVGVTLDAFPYPEAEQVEEPADVAAMGHPRIGFIGALHDHVDLGLLESAVERTPEWNWIFIGPVSASAGKLKEFSNCHLFDDGRPHHQLSAYLQSFDVGIVPYAQKQFVRSMVPTKVNEYLACGLPVVSTEIPSVRHLNADGEIVLTPNEPGAFVAAVTAALEMPRDAQALQRRR
ncbi:MAG TPA: glycosyltransferase, partial [Thermoanaerobaculia bacterium]|nr:glycosyltransferase [Thermoanaerobaculia bacterium]